MKAFVKKLNYSFDEENHIWLKPNQQGIAHNRQNKIEERLARIIRGASDLSLFSSELRNLQKDWMATYHLSAVRSNVMRPFQKIFLNKDVLEVGSGCGAITRYLGECGANVLAIEENFHKATITRSRTRDLTNVTVLSEQFSIFQNIIVDKKFDVITLVGAYQHLNLFGSEESPMLALLEHSYKLLKPEGKLIIAIENPLGLKYFAGAAENEVVSPLYGTQANFNDNKVKALSRVTFSNILQKTQFKNVKFLLPFPDYKLPNSILTEEGIKNTNFDPTPFAYQNIAHDRQRPQYPNFNQELVWNEIVKNGLLLELANSFLVVASPNSNQLIDTSILAYHYTMHRATKYNKETLFKQTKNNGKITVLYKKMLPYVETTIQSEKPILNFDVPNSDQYILGRLFSLSLLEIITKKDWTFDQIASFFSHYLQLIQNFAQSEGLNIDITSLYTTLPSHFFDIIPHNIIVTKDGKPYVIDQEWSFNQPMELGYLLLRVFFSVFSSTFCAPKHQSKITFQEFVDGTLSLLGLKFKRKDYVRYVILENKINKLVYDLKTDTAIILDNLLTHQLLTLSSGETLLMREHTINNLHGEISNLHSEISNQHNEINNLNHVIKEREHHISAIVSSRSWQVTKPLRFLSRLVRGKFSEAFASFQKYKIGRCNLCGRFTRFLYSDRALWRESLICTHCGTTSRYRSIGRGILCAIADLSGVEVNSLTNLPNVSKKFLRIYDTQPPFYFEHAYPIPDLLKAKQWIKVDISKYDPEQPLGKILAEDMSNQNLEKLTFDDESFDIIVTSDVMEHVRLDTQAHKEIYRTLKLGGIYIFTVPHNPSHEETLVRVQVNNPTDPSQDIYLLEPEYHGDANSKDGKGALSYRVYGTGLNKFLEEVGFNVKYFPAKKKGFSITGILNAELFYCKKIK